MWGNRANKLFYLSDETFENAGMTCTTNIAAHRQALVPGYSCVKITSRYIVGGLVPVAYISIKAHIIFRTKILTK